MTTGKGDGEWVDLLLRSIGMEPSHFERRVKLLFLIRLLPLCEHNYNLVELGPRGTGKSYAYQELSPYTILLTGPTTVANLFYNMASGKIGLVGIWVAIGFDEVADLQKMPKEVVTTLKTYCESGTFARGKESLSGMASAAMFGFAATDNQAIPGDHLRLVSLLHKDDLIGIRWTTTIREHPVRLWPCNGCAGLSSSTISGRSVSHATDQASMHEHVVKQER